MSMGKDRDEDEWEVGDIGSDLEDELVPEDPEGWREKHPEVEPLTKADVWRAISQYYGKAPDTIRGYIRVSRGVSKKLRNEFDMLFRTHHVAILDFSKGKEERHRELCEKVLAWGDEYGTIPSVSVVRDLLAEKEGDGPPLWVRWASSLERTAKKLKGNDDVPKDVEQVTGRFIRDLHTTSYKQYVTKKDAGSD